MKISLIFRRCKNVEQREKNLRIVAIIVCVLVIAFGVWYLCTEPNVHDQRERANDVRNELSNAGTAQRDAQSHIDNAGQRIDGSLELADEVAERIDEAAERIADSEKRNAECAGILADSERRIAESRAIIQGIRERARQD